MTGFIKKIFRSICFFFLTGLLTGVCLLRFSYMQDQAVYEIRNDPDVISDSSNQKAQNVNAESASLLPDRTLELSSDDVQTSDNDPDEPLEVVTRTDVMSISEVSSGTRKTPQYDPVVVSPRPSPAVSVPSPSPKPYIRWSPVEVPSAQATPEVQDINTPDTRPSDEKTYADMDWWSRDWYGFWIKYNCSGDFTAQENSWLDCCASADIDESGTGIITLWDEETTYAEPLGNTSVLVNENGTGYGILTSVKGSFAGKNFGESDGWTGDPSRCPYENMLPVSGRYTDSTGSYDYLIILRPWGTQWTDIRKEDVQDYSTYHYDDWYIPLLEKGICNAPESSVGS